MKAQQLKKLIREEIKTVLNEGVEQRDQKVKRMVTGIAGEFGYSEEDAVFFIMESMKRLGYVKNYEI
jgi:hypothetical protein